MRYTVIKINLKFMNSYFSFHLRPPYTTAIDGKKIENSTVR